MAERVRITIFPSGGHPTKVGSPRRAWQRDIALWPRRNLLFPVIRSLRDAKRSGLKTSLRSSLSKGRDPFELAGKAVRRFPCVETRLHVQPQIGSIAAQLTESGSHIRGYRPLAGHHPVQGLPTDVKQPGNLHDRAVLAAKLGQDVALEEYTRMHRRARDLVPLNRKLV